MIRTVCKYAPVELYAGFGEQTAPYNPLPDNLDAADELTHRNVCAFSRALISGQAADGPEPLVLTDCCDSIRRAADVLRSLGREVWMLSLPRRQDACGRALYTHELLRYLGELEARTGKDFDAGAFRDAFGSAFGAASGDAFRPAERRGGPYVAVMGARMGDALLEAIRAASPLPVLNNTCTGQRRLGAPPAVEGEALMEWYADELLAQPACMRMFDLSSRRALTEDPNLRGIVYNTVKFCDFYGFEYAALRDALPLPMLKIETDYTPQGAAQVLTRLQAFFEGLQPPAHRPHHQRGDPGVVAPAGDPGVVAPGSNTGHPFGVILSGPIPDLPQSGQDSEESFVALRTGSRKPRQGDSSLEARRHGTEYYAGVDSGSTTTNAVILDAYRTVVAFCTLPTGVQVAESGRRALEAALAAAGLERERIRRTVSTGYGRACIAFRERDVTEITCHARGAHFLDPSVRTVIDVGGQDSKVIRLDERGGVRSFVMNDKCAAGTGRFLEMMAGSLGLSIEEMAVRGLSSREEITISSMCSVFAQSEVVSLLAAGKRLEDIVRGLNRSVAAKVTSLAGRSGLEREWMMTGGVARNPGVVAAIEERLGGKLRLPEQPELCGALGAALMAIEL